MCINSRFCFLSAILPLATIALLVQLAIMPSLGMAQQASDLLNHAEALENQQNFPASESIYRRVLASDPDNADALKYLGILEQTDLKFSDSIAHFKRVLAGQPDYPQVNFFLGLSYYGLHDYKNADSSFQQELKTAAPHPATRYYLALALEGEGLPDDAIYQLNQVAAKNRNKSEIFYELARLHTAASFRAIDELRRIDPDSFQFHALMGEFYDQEAHYPAAIIQYEAALKKQPNAQGIHTRLGIAYWRLDQFPAAEKEL